MFIEDDFILFDNFIAIYNTRKMLNIPMVMRYNLILALLLKVMAMSFLVKVPYFIVV